MPYKSRKKLKTKRSFSKRLKMSYRSNLYRKVKRRRSNKSHRRGGGILNSFNQVSSKVKSMKNSVVKGIKNHQMFSLM